jgi:RNA polymerase sigma-54 factor
MYAQLRIDHRQQQALSPRLQHAVRLLQMSSLDFASELRDTMERNPFLEPGEGDEDLAEVARLAGVPTSSIAEPLATPDEIATPDAGGELADPGGVDEPDFGEREAWLADGVPVPTREGDEGAVGVLDLMAAGTGLRAHLHGQLNLLSLPPRDMVLARAIVESLDDDGYLRQPLDGLLHEGELAPPPTAEEMQIALRRVQSLDPAGVGARTVAECLRLQLPSIECERQRATARTIVDRHLDRLAARDLPRLQQLLGEPGEHVAAVCERIRHLDPRPGWRFDSELAPYVVPDIVVKKIRGVWTATLNPAVVPRIRLNQMYADMYQRQRHAADDELAAHLKEARWTLRNVAQRFTTILAVAQAIIRHQPRFFDLGSMAMKPLALKQVAAEIGVHESTVSRATCNKYMATPLGVFELKQFFSRALIAESGNTFSGTAVRELVKEMIAEERPEAPLSDAHIARTLEQQGLAIARRTVTKYRRALRIEAVERRRLR